jgi:hypothetical protein
MGLLKLSGKRISDILMCQLISSTVGFDDHFHGRKTPVDSTYFIRNRSDSGFSMVHCNNFDSLNPFFRLTGYIQMLR